MNENQRKVYGRTMILREIQQAKSEGAGFAIKLKFPNIEGEMYNIVTHDMLDFFSVMVVKMFDEEGEMENGARIDSFQIVESVDHHIKGDGIRYI